LIQNNSVPIASLSYNTFDASAKLDLYQTFIPESPNTNFFEVPHTCLPPRFSDKNSVYVPTFPTAYTLYIEDPLNLGERTIIYRNAQNGLTRIDSYGYITIQQENNIFLFLDQSNSESLNPAPCWTFPYLDPIWMDPQFMSFFANGSVEGKPAKIWNVEISQYGDKRTDYWYMGTDGTPLYSVGLQGFKEFSYFQPTPPPSQFFDVHRECVLVHSEQLMFKTQKNIHSFWDLNE